MPYKGRVNKTQTNTVGRVIVRDTTPPKSAPPASDNERTDIIRNLKKVARTQNRPSRSDQERR